MSINKSYFLESKTFSEKRFASAGSGSCVYFLFLKFYLFKYVINNI